MALNGDIEEIRNYKVGVKFKWLLGDISGVLNQILKTKNPGALNNLFDSKDGYDDLYKDDPLPFFAMFYLMAKRNIKNKFSK